MYLIKLGRRISDEHMGTSFLRKLFICISQSRLVVQSYFLVLVLFVLRAITFEVFFLVRGQLETRRKTALSLTKFKRQQKQSDHTGSTDD
jgi:hypothetical protein